jgi:hypothetical protein
MSDYNNAENIIKQYYFVASQKKGPKNKPYSTCLMFIKIQDIDQTISLLEQTILTDRLTKIQKGFVQQFGF